MRRALLAILLLVPLAAADHVFSHRVHVVGRVVDDDGTPAAGIPIEAAFEGLAVAGRCFDSKEEVTGPRGDFSLCRTTQDIGSAARVLVRAGDAAREVAVDAELRHAVANLQLGGPSPTRDITGEREFEQTFLVTGRSFALLPRPENADGILVNATPLGENVTARLLDGERVVAEANATPDEYGTYAAELAVGDVPAGAIVRVTNGRERAEVVAAELHRRADVNLLRDLRLSDGQGEGAPGSQTPLPAALTWAAVAIAAFAGSRGTRRRPR